MILCHNLTIFSYFAYIFIESFDVMIYSTKWIHCVQWYKEQVLGVIYLWLNCAVNNTFGFKSLLLCVAVGFFFIIDNNPKWMESFLILVNFLTFTDILQVYWDNVYVIKCNCTIIKELLTHINYLFFIVNKCTLVILT